MDDELYTRTMQMIDALTRCQAQATMPIEKMTTGDIFDELDKRAQVTARNARIMPVNAWGSIPTAEPQPEQPKHGPFTTTYPIP